MSPLGWVVVLQAVAIGLLFAEIFLPSGGILALATLGAVVASLWTAFDGAAALGWGTLLVDLLVFPWLVRWGFRTVSKSAMALQESLETGSATESTLQWVGQTGFAETGLRPVGHIRIGEHRLQARSATGFVEPGEAVQVIRSEGGEVLVRPVRS